MQRLVTGEVEIRETALVWLGASPNSKGENLRHLHRLHPVRACMPHRCPRDGPGHHQRSQAGGFVPTSGGSKGDWIGASPRQ